MKNETIVFTDVYGKEYTTYKQVCVEYNLHPKTLAKRKASALKKGNTDIHGLIEKYIIEKNPDYKTKQINAKKTQSLKERVAKTKAILDNATPVNPVNHVKPVNLAKPVNTAKTVKRDLPIESFEDFEDIYDSVDTPADETPSVKSPETIKIIQSILDAENGDGSDGSSKPVKTKPKTKKNVAQLIKLLENKPVIPKTNVFYDEAVALCGQDELLAAYRKIINKYIGDSIKMGVINEHYLQALKYFDDVKIWVQSIDLPEIN